MLKLGVCDDDKAVCEWLRQKLLHYGEMCGEPLEIYCYLSENALLETLEENQFDIIFLDIQLEKSNGIQIGEEIRKNSMAERYGSPIFPPFGSMQCSFFISIHLIF